VIQSAGFLTSWFPYHARASTSFQPQSIPISLPLSDSDRFCPHKFDKIAPPQLLLPPAAPSDEHRPSNSALQKCLRKLVINSPSMDQYSLHFVTLHKANPLAFPLHFIHRCDKTTHLCRLSAIFRRTRQNSRSAFRRATSHSCNPIAKTKRRSDEHAEFIPFSRRPQAASHSAQAVSKLSGRTMTMDDPKAPSALLRLGAKTFPLRVSASPRLCATCSPIRTPFPHALPPLAAPARKSHSTFARSAPIADLTISGQSRPPNSTIYGTFAKTLAPRNRPLHASRRAKVPAPQHSREKKVHPSILEPRTDSTPHLLTRSPRLPPQPFITYPSPTLTGHSDTRHLDTNPHVQSQTTPAAQQS
jgi:hypothetical protein